MEPMSDREKLFFMMAFDLGVDLGESGKMNEMREDELRRNKDADMTIFHLEFANKFLDDNNFNGYVKIFANLIWRDFILKEQRKQKKGL